MTWELDFVTVAALDVLFSLKCVILLLIRQLMRCSGKR